jgi:hypothetical protein
MLSINFPKVFGGQGGIFSKNTPLQVQGNALPFSKTKQGEALK